MGWGKEGLDGCKWFRYRLRQVVETVKEVGESFDVKKTKCAGAEFLCVGAVLLMRVI